MILRTGVDTYNRQANQSESNGKATKLWMSDDSGGKRYAYIYFPRPFAYGVVITAGILRVVLASGWGGTQSITVKRIVEPWKESRLNWNNKPAVTDDDAATIAVNGQDAGDEVEVNIASMLTDVANGGLWFGVRLEINSSADRAIHSSDAKAAANHPSIEVEWSTAPHTPANLAPAGGRAVSATKPLLTWQFIDNAGSTTQAYSRVQVSTSSDFSSPVYDSTKVANTLSRWDLAATAFSAIGDENPRYWRVMVWDGGNQASPWSPVQSFVRKSKGTLDITNPDVGEVTEETTPPVAWTFTGRTQEAFAAALYRINANGSATLLVSQPKVVSTATEWQVPAGYIREGYDYRVVVSVFDTIERQPMATDTDYVTAVRNFTYERDGTPDPVLTLSATPDGPRVALEWTRDEDPDYFALRVGGQMIFDRLEVADVFVSGDTYAFDYWLATPRQSRVYEVEAVVVDGGVAKHSSGNAVDSAETRPIGIWLSDPDDATGVLIAGKEKASMSIGEVSAQFDVLGSRAPVTIIDSIQGYRGAFNGILTDADGVTASEARDTFLELKGRLKTLRLIIGDLNIPVELGRITGPMPVPSGDGSYDVGFEFAQVAEFDEAFEVAGSA